MNPELPNMEKKTSQDQCGASDSAHDESCGKHGQDMKVDFFLGNPEIFNASSAEINQPMFQHSYSDPHFNGMFAAYGPHNMIQPHVMGSAFGRVPLPPDLPEDGPIYVNAKQYHGILRRRQTRAKLEAQNKLVKTRKPYLHESRHQHALNRVRGSGGRFLRTKQQQQQHESTASTSSTPTPHTFLFDHKTSLKEPSNYCDGEGAQGGSNGSIYHGNRHYASSTVR